MPVITAIAVAAVSTAGWTIAVIGILIAAAIAWKEFGGGGDRR
jgi:hypothetical protein